MHDWRFQSGNSLEQLEGIFRNYLNEEEIQQFESNFLKNFTLENVVQYLTILNAPALLNMVEAAMQTLQKHMHRQERAMHWKRMQRHMQIR